jgi:hypothetical protein
MATPTKTATSKTTTGEIAERVASLRELAERSPGAAQDATWAWFKELGASAGGDREGASARLAELFGCGQPSSGIDGPTEGIFVTPLIQPQLDGVIRTVTKAWMPWNGKSFYADEQRGDNRLIGSIRVIGRLLWPLYSTSPGAKGERNAFDFETRVERGEAEPAVDVLVIDYAPVDRNPRLVIKSIRDELVEIVPNTHLGRILYRRGDGYANIGYFALKTPAA